MEIITLYDGISDFGNFIFFAAAFGFRGASEASKSSLQFRLLPATAAGRKIRARVH